MSGKCRNCGTDYGLHHYKTNQCPTFGKESPVGVKQEYQASVFAEGIPYDELLSQLAALLEACKEVRLMLNTDLKDYKTEPWAMRVEAAIAQAEKEG